MKEKVKSDAAILRQKAEDTMRSNPLKSGLPLSEIDILRLIQELQVHQVELEMQNEELRLAKEQVELTSKKYTELYDFSPIGYFTLSKEGLIIEVNHIGAKMLGKDHGQLIDNSFGFFVCEPFKSIFNGFLKNVFNSKTNSSCEITITSRKDFEIDVRLTGIVQDHGPHCLVTMDDITERKNAERLLYESEQQRIAVLDKASDGYVLLNHQGFFLEVNETFSQMAGYSKKELLAMRIADLITDPNEQDIAAQFQKIIIQGEDRFESLHRRKDGSSYHVEVSIQYQPFKREFIVFLHNISGRKQREKDLFESNEQFRLLFENSSDAIFFTNPDGSINLVNPEAERMLGRSKEEIIKLTRNDISDENDPRLIPALKERIGTGHFKGELNFLRRDRTPFPVELTSTCFKDSNGIERASIIARDISERKEAEEALLEKEALLNKAEEIGHLGSWSLDLITNRLIWSDEIYRIFGLQPQEFAATYEGFLEAVHPEDREAVNAAYTHSILEGKDSYEIEHRVVRKYSGELRYVTEKCEHIRDASGKIVRSVGMVNDITERKLAEQALRESEKRVRFKLQSILSPEGNIANLELEDIIDVPSIQMLMDHFYELSQIPMSIIDVSGKVLVGVGWQDVCTKFHRVNPMSCANCIESDVHLTQGIPDGEFRTYKCKNQLWDMATPLIIGGELKGNLFMGQFFFEDEPIDYTLFRKQAGQYGFDKLSYRNALEKAPRVSQQKIDHAKAFFLNLSRSISQLSYSNIKLARAITQQKQTEEALYHYIGAQEKLSIASTQLLGTLSLSELNHFAVEQIRQLAGHSIVIMNEYNPETQQTIIRAASGSGNKLSTLEAIINQPLIGIGFRVVNDLWQPTDTSGFTPVEGGLYNHSFIPLPEEICHHIEDELEIKALYIMPLMVADELMGTIAIGVESISGIQNKSLIESFIKQVALSFKNKRTEESLKESEKKYRELVKFAPTPIYEFNYKTQKIVTANDAMIQLSGYSPEELYSMDVIDLLDEESKSTFMTRNNSLLKGEKLNENVEYKARTKNGNLVHVVLRIQFKLDEHGKLMGATIILHDITERIAKEQTLQKLNKTLSALSKSSQAMLQAEDEADYLKQVCNIVVEDTDFTMVWMGYAQEDEAKSIRPVASAGFNDDYLQSIKISWDESEWGQGPTGTAIRTGNICMCNNILTDPAFEPWREQALKRGYASSIVFPLQSGSKTFGAICIYSKETNSFLEDEIKLLSELANDLAHGITTLRLRVAHQMAEEALSKSHKELELQVKLRTRELEIANESLKKEINIGKQQEQSLKLAEEKYRTVADHTHGWEFWLDKDDRFLYCSPSCERITGYPATAFLERPALLFEIIHPHDKKSFLHHHRNEDLCQVQDHELEYRIVRADGSIRWIGHECQPIADESGHFMGIRGSNKDITKRKEIEQLLKTSSRKYRLLSANISDGIFISKNGCLEYVNKAMRRIFGFTHYKMEGLMLTQLAMPDYQEELKNILIINSSLNQFRTIEIECFKKDHSIINIEILFHYVAKEKVIYGVVHDITEKKQIQTNIVKAIILTEEKERAYFSKELHDGLGPLLSTIKLYLQWSQRPKNNKSHEEILLLAEGILEEALTTVKEISNKLSPHLLTNHGLTAAIKSFVDKLEETALLEIDFESNVSRRLDNEIEVAFYRAVIECINNTIKHAGANNIFIRLNDMGSRLQLEYSDDGIGFDLEETHQLKKGLGLYNLQNRIETIGGKITMVSSPGMGLNYKISVNL